MFRPLFLTMLALTACGESSDEKDSPSAGASDDTATDASDGAPERLELDLEDPLTNSETFVRVRGSLDPDQQVYFYWDGYIYNHRDVDPYAAGESDWGYPILRFEGYNVARFEPVGDGVYDMLTREVAVYKNLQGEIIDCWNNAAIDADEPESVRVVHVQNDPVNFQVSGGDYAEIGDMLAFRMEVLLSYPSALSVDDHPEYSASNTYQSVELFNFYASRDDLENPALESVPAHISWTRYGQYLPWMKMGQRDGKLVYHTQGYKTLDWTDLPADLRSWVDENAPEYRDAPSSARGNNVTSWRYFESLVSSGQYDSSCP